MRSDGTWRASTRSGGNGDCVEVAWVPGVVAVRDSKDRSGPALTFPEPVWQAFIESAPPKR